MAVLIKDGDVERLIRELVDRSGENITEAVRTSVAERLSRLMPDSGDVARRKRRLREITAYFDGLPRAEHAVGEPS
jgi:hypothetical protein